MRRTGRTPIEDNAENQANTMVPGVFPLVKQRYLFILYLAVAGLCLWIARKKAPVYYACLPVLTILILLFSFAVPASVPVTNDLTQKEPNCAYTLKSTSEDMALFCGELMRQYHSGNAAMKEMFAPAVKIDNVNSWGLGIAIESGNGGETYWHSGINSGFQSLFVLYPSQDKYIVILTNSDSGLDFSKESARAFLGINGAWEIIIGTGKEEDVK